MRRIPTARENELHEIIDPYIVFPSRCADLKERYPLCEDAPQEVREARIELLKIIDDYKREARSFGFIC